MAWKEGYGRGFRRWVGSWTGRGPFSYLPPWHRPGWLFGRGMCRPFFNVSKEEEILILENDAKVLEQELERIRKRLEELKK